MSIAVAMLLQTPPPITAALRIICGGFLFLTIPVWFGLGIEMKPQFRLLTAGMCLAAGLFGIYYSRRLVKSFYISISSHGSITLAPVSSTLDETRLNGDCAPQNARLMPGTTVLPSLIVMRLLLSNEQTVFIAVMKGIIEEQRFRTLAVACKWILRQNDPAQGAKT